MSRSKRDAAKEDEAVREREDEHLESSPLHEMSDEDLSRWMARARRDHSHGDEIPSVVRKVKAAIERAAPPQGPPER